MKPSTINFALGVALIALGAYFLANGGFTHGWIPAAVGITLIYQSRARSRASTLIFGHLCVIVGTYLITWGILLLPYSEPVIGHIFGRPLFWGFISLFGGICAIFHGFCRCIMKSVDEFEGAR